MSAGTGIGAEDGDGTIEIGMMSREILPKAGAGRGAGTMATAVAWAFFSRAGYIRPQCDVTRTSHVGLRRCGHDFAGQGALTAHLRGNRDTSGKLQRRRTRDATHQF